jgi:hypothetical protein
MIASKEPKAWKIVPVRPSIEEMYPPKIKPGCNLEGKKTGHRKYPYALVGAKRSTMSYVLELRLCRHRDHSFLVETGRRD